MTTDLEQLVVTHWDVSPPVRLRPLESGTNNQSYLVSAGSKTFILKRLLNVGAPDRLPFEHALLNALARRDLPFAVPAPMRTRSDNTVVSFDDGKEVCRVALFPRIPGRPAMRGNRDVAARCGRALAVLDSALAQVEIDPAITVPDSFGSLATELRELPAVTARINRVFLDRPDSKALSMLLERADREWMRATSGWAPQLIHGDLFPPNVLVEAGEVSGILDFEFAEMGYRAMDFAVGLVAFSVPLWDEGPDWPILETFAANYLKELPLPSHELGAIPELVRMREAASFVHWLGRMELGLSTRDDIHQRADRLRQCAGWLDAHRGDLVDHLCRIASP